MRKTWTQEKINFIKENLSTMSVKELAKYFNVSYSAMTSIIHNNGLSAKKAHGISWSKDDDELLTKHFEYAPKIILCVYSRYEHGHLFYKEETRLLIKNAKHKINFI